MTAAPEAAEGGMGELAEMDESYINLIIRFLNENEQQQNGSATGGVDLRRPYIKTSLRYVYPLFILLHAVVAAAGTAGNAAVLVVIIKNRLYKNPTFFFIGNLAFSDILKAAAVLPLTITNLLIQNWILGSFLCYFLPMMHSFPIHGSMLTYIVLAVDRYRFIVRPMRSRVPAGLCCVGVWVAAVCLVLPYAVYVKYIDVGAILGPQLDGVGICWLNLEYHIEVFIRAMFVTLYCLPLAVITFLYIKVSAELKAGGDSPVAVHIDDLTRIGSGGGGLAELSTCSTWAPTTSAAELSDYRIEPDGQSTESGALPPHTPSLATSGGERRHTSSSRRRRRHSSIDDDEINIRKEKRTQKYLITMVTLFAMCWCPLNILILVTHMVYESDDNSGHFDITYVTFVFFGFLSTCINPVLFASWHMSAQTKDRLRGYFRLSNRRRGSGHSQMRRNTQDSVMYSARNSPSPHVVPRDNGHVYDACPPQTTPSSSKKDSAFELPPSSSNTLLPPEATLKPPGPGASASPRRAGGGGGRAGRSHSTRHAPRRRSHDDRERDRRHSSGNALIRPPSPGGGGGGAHRTGRPHSPRGPAPARPAPEIRRH